MELEEFPSEAEGVTPTIFPENAGYQLQRKCAPLNQVQRVQ